MTVCVSDPSAQQQEEKKKDAKFQEVHWPSSLATVSKQGNPVTSTSGGPLTATESQREMGGGGEGERREVRKREGWQDGSH